MRAVPGRAGQDQGQRRLRGGADRVRRHPHLAGDAADPRSLLQGGGRTATPVARVPRRGR